MSTFKAIEKYRKIKKLIIALTIILVVLDTIIGFANPAYLLSSSSVIVLGFAGYSLVNEYERYRIEHKSFSKVILIFSLILAAFSVYHILLNLVNMSGTFV